MSQHLDEATAAVISALATVIDPEIRQPITELNMVGSVVVTDAASGDAAGDYADDSADALLATIAIRLTIAGCPAADTIERDVRAAAASVPGIGDVHVIVSIMTPGERASLTEKLRAGRPREQQFGADSLTRIYAITSGKGGVGKSTITANLGVALAARGLRVGIVDADVFGFSIPALLGLDGAVPTRVDEMILPPIGYGVKVISIGMFLPNDGASRAVSWRGPMLHRTIQQFLTDVFFGDLDVLLIDLPPGTGDVAISLGQLLPHAEVIVVTTPQVAAAEVAERSAIVARQTGQKVIGVIENMAGLMQPDGTLLNIFGTGGGADVAARLTVSQATGDAPHPSTPVPVLASIPLSIALRQGGDDGVPVVLANPVDPAAAAILAVAEFLGTRGHGLAGRKLGLSVL